MAGATLSGTEDWTELWLAYYRKVGHIGLACQAVGVSRQAVYSRRDMDPAFAQRWADALEDAVESLEVEADRRAREGSDVLLMFLLKGMKPEKYRDNPKVYVNAGRMSDAEIIAAAKGVLVGAAGTLPADSSTAQPAMGSKGDAAP